MGNQIELYKQQAEEGIQAIHNMLIENGGDLQENLSRERRPVHVECSLSQLLNLQQRLVPRW